MKHQNVHTSIKSVANSPQFMCPIRHCLKVFSQQELLQRHMDSHQGNYGFLHMCKEQHCGMAFKTVADLNKHVYRSHGGRNLRDLGYDEIARRHGVPIDKKNFIDVTQEIGDDERPRQPDRELRAVVAP